MKNYNLSILVLSLFLLFSCEEKKMDTVENNDTVAAEESVQNFDYKDVTGEFGGDYEGKNAVLNLNSGGDYTLQYDSKNFEGKYYYQGDGSEIELEFMEYQASLPFYMLKIEDPTYLVIIKDGQFTDYYLEKNVK